MFNQEMLEKQLPVSLVSIVYSNEIPLLKIQLKSLAIYADKTLFNEHLIICNDEKSVYDALKLELENLDYPFKITVLCRNDILNDRNELFAGWYLQQSLKLYAARYISNDHYLVLDAKNHLIRPLQADALFSSGKPIMYTLSKKGDVYSAIMKRSSECLGFDNTDFSRFSVPVTPFLIITKHVLQMLTILEREENGVVDAIAKKVDGTRATEFMLYSVFLSHLGHFSDHEPISYKKTKNLTLFKSFDFKNVNEAKKKIKSTLWFGVHLQHFYKNRQATFELCYEVWEESGLIANKSDVDAIFRDLDYFS